MANSKKITHVIADQAGYVSSKHTSEELAIAAATRALNANRNYVSQIGIFELVSVVKQKVAPVEVTRVKICAPCKDEK